MRFPRCTRKRRPNLNMSQFAQENVMRGQSGSTKELIEYSRRLLEQDHPQTLRQLHYAIFSRHEIDYANEKSSYVRLSRVTTTARRNYRAWEFDVKIDH